MAFICYEEKLLLIRTFQHNYFKDFKDEMIKEIETNYMDFDSSDGERLDTENFKARQIVYESLSTEIISKLEILIYSTLKTKVKTIYVENEVTITTYEEGDYLTKFKNPVYDSCRDTLCMYMLLSLQEADDGGEFKLHTRDCNSLTVSSDVLFDKSIVHECSQVKAGKKRIAVFNVIVKLKSEKGVIGTINYMDNNIYLYDNNKDKIFCYYEIEFMKSSLHSEHFFVGVITNKSGKCILVHNNFEVNTSEDRIFNSLQELTLYLVGNEYKKISLKNADNDDIGWNDSNQSFLPNDKELFTNLTESIKKENIKCYELELEKHDDVLSIFCMVGKYYFNLPDSKTIVEYVISNSLDNANIPDWKELSDLHKRYILSWMPYEELFELVTNRKESNGTDSSDTEEYSESETEYKLD